MRKSWRLYLRFLQANENLLLLVFWGDCCHSPIARTKSNIFRALEDAL